jgi:PAS domain S-box-containing protein
VLAPLGSFELFDLAPVALAVLDLEGRPRAVNRRFRELFELGEDVTAEDGYPRIAESDDRARTATAVAGLIAGVRDRVELEQRFLAPDGSLVCARFSATRLVDGEGQVVGVTAAVVDVSAEQEQRVSLDQAHRRLEAMLANISDTVTMVDATGQVIDTTGLHTSIMGYESDYWKQRSVFDLVDHDDLPRLLEAYEQVLASPGEQVTLDLQVLQADGEWADIELTAVNLLDDASVGAIVITSRNITDRKRTEVELAAHRDRAVEQARLRSEFVARVSHELRNQLHALRGLTELIATTEVPRSVAQLVETANRQAEQFGYLVDDLLEFSSFEAGRVTAHPQPCWPRQIAADVVASGRERAAAGVEVLARTDEAVADVVVADERRVRQVLTNLVSNAAKFTRAGSIQVLTAPAELHGEPALRWTVRDTGRGIPSEDLERIFHPFEQGSARSTRGSGLGLAITERIVSMLGGRIEVSSTVGTGSEFSVVLPATPTDEVPDQLGGDAAPLRPRANVLVVEDNEVNQMLVAEQLARLGARATVVGDGHEALAVLSGPDDIDCVLMDWQLPGLDGVEATRRQRVAEAGTGRRIPIVGLTASGRPADRRVCLDAGMDDLLVKPVGLAELARALHPYIGERRSVPRPVGGGRTGGADTEALDSLVDQLGSVATVRSIVGTFLEELRRREAAVVAAVDDGDEQLLRRTAHTLRSMSGTLGATALDRLSRVLESSEFPPDPGVLQAFGEAVDSTRHALEGWLADQDPSQVGDEASTSVSASASASVSR